MKKHLLFTFGFLLFSAVSLAQSDDILKSQTDEFQRAPDASESSWHLIMWHKDGSRVMFKLDEMPKVIYSGDNVIIESSSTVEYAFQTIKKMTYSFTQDLPTGICDLKIKQEKPFANNGRTISFLPAEEDLHVRIVSMNGMIIKDFVVRKDEPISISLTSSLEKVFLINVNGVTYKIMIR